MHRAADAVVPDCGGSGDVGAGRPQLSRERRLDEGRSCCHLLCLVSWDGRTAIAAVDCAALTLAALRAPSALSFLGQFVLVVGTSFPVSL